MFGRSRAWRSGKSSPSAGRTMIQCVGRIRGAVPTGIPGKSRAAPRKPYSTGQPQPRSILTNLPVQYVLTRGVRVGVLKTPRGKREVHSVEVRSGIAVVVDLDVRSPIVRDRIAEVGEELGYHPATRVARRRASKWRLAHSHGGETGVSSAARKHRCVSFSRRRESSNLVSRE